MSHHTSVDENALIDLRFLIPSKAAGVVIGKGGDNVKDIREKYEIKVNIPDSSGPERVLHVSGMLGNVMEALENMLEKLQESMPASEADLYDPNKNRNRYRPRRDEDDGAGGTGDDHSGGVDLRMLIHQSQAGTVIGRGGEQIKELREKSGLRSLKVYQIVCPLSTDRLVQMVGDVQKVVICVRAVIDKLHNFQLRGPEQPYDARNFDESQVLSYGGWLGKVAFKALQEYGAQALSGLSSGAAGGMGGMPPGHLPPAALAALASARANMMNLPTGNHGASLHSHPSAMAAAANPMMMMSMMMPASLPRAEPRRGTGGRMDRGGDVMSGLVKTVQVSVPNSYMGSIMGRGGVRIRSIREESGADIRVHGPDSGDRIIDITGTEPQISYAQQLLKSCVLIYHERK